MASVIVMIVAGVAAVIWAEALIPRWLDAMRRRADSDDLRRSVTRFADSRKLHAIYHVAGAAGCAVAFVGIVLLASDNY